MQRFVHRILSAASVLAGFALVTSVPAFSQQTTSQTKPNILVIMGDDIGYWNISAYNRGLMGYRTPNIASSSVNVFTICRLSA